MRILFTGGGSGGHVTPIVATIRELKRIAKENQILDLELFYLGPDNFEAGALKEEGVVVIHGIAGKWRNYKTFENFKDIFKIFIGIIQALWNFLFLVPDVVFSKGGYGAFPSVIAAIIFRIPLIIHESDAVPGKVNQFSSRFATRIGISFPGAAAFFPNEKTALTGIPIRKRIFGGNREEARDVLEVYSQSPIIGIIGASQGSQKINDAVLGILPELAEEFEIIHQTGEKNYEDVKNEATVILEKGKKEHYHPFSFFEEGRLRSFYSASDLIVSRGSGTMIFEIAAWGKPSILIPLGIAAQDHQRKNAYEYAATGAAVVIEEQNLSPHILLGEVKKIIGNPALMKKMSEAAQRFARIDSGDIIAREILKLGIH